MIAALAAALVLSMDGTCARLELLDVFGEVPFDTPVTSELIGTTLRGNCRDPGGTCRLHDRTGVAYEVSGGRVVSKTRPPAWNVELPFGLRGRSYREITEALKGRGISDDAMTIFISTHDPGRVEVAVCGRPLKLRISQNSAGRARSVAIIPADRP